VDNRGARWSVPPSQASWPDTAPRTLGPPRQRRVHRGVHRGESPLRVPHAGTADGAGLWRSYRQASALHLSQYQLVRVSQTAGRRRAALIDQAIPPMAVPETGNL